MKPIQLVDKMGIAQKFITQDGTIHEGKITRLYIVDGILTVKLAVNNAGMEIPAFLIKAIEPIDGIE